MKPSQFFVVQFDSDTQTRWLASLAEFTTTLELLGRSAADMHTDGSRPRVTVRTLEQFASDLERETYSALQNSQAN